MALILGELAAILKTDNSRLKRGLDEGERDFRRTGRQMDRDASATASSVASSWISRLASIGGASRSNSRQLSSDIDRTRAKVRELAQEYDRTGNKRLLKDLGRERSQLRSLEAAARELGTGGLASARTALSNFGTGVTNVVTNVWNLIPALAGLAAGAAFAVPAVYLLGGALASLPALAAGGGAAIGTLALGFAGLTDHFKKSASAGGAVVDKTWQIRQAQRALANSQREAADAQEALTRAREDEVERLSDLNRELREARLGELEAAEQQKEAQKELADAQNAVNIAQDKLDRAKATGDISAIQQATQDLLDAQQQQPDVIYRAQLAYERSKLTLESAKDSTSDLAKEQERANKVGVEGSDQVRAALDRQRQAIEALADAQHALDEARKPAGGGGGGVGQELMRLAPAAQELVNVIKSLKPAWESLRLDVQQRLFTGVGREVRLLASAWLPTLHDRLGGMAGTFNGLFKLFSRSVRKPEFIAGISAGIESVQRLIDRVGRSVAGPFVDAFGRLSRAAGPFIDALGDEIGDLVDDFSAWIRSADNSGGLERFMKQASDFLHDAFDMGRDVGSIFGSIMSILFGEKSLSTSPWVSLKVSLDGVAAWFKDPENQEKVREWIDRIKDFGKWLFTEGLPTVARWVQRIDGWLTTADEWGNKIVGFKNRIVGAFNSVVGFFRGLPGRISKVTSGMWNGLWTSFRSTLNRIIGAWNNLSFTVGGGSVLGVPVPSLTLNTPNIPYLANGGIVRATPGGRLAVVGEGREDEAVIPLSKLNGLGGPRELRITGELVARGRDLVLVLRETVALGGGSVQKVIGSNS